MDIAMHPMIRPAHFRTLLLAGTLGLLSGCSWMPFTGGPDWQTLNGTVGLSDSSKVQQGQIHLSLVDQDDGGSRVAVTQQRVTGTWPEHFELMYDHNGIDTSHHYALKGSLVIDGKLRYVEREAVPALTQGAPESAVQLVLTPR
ncbi:YbaY family lipoprotein [Carnimonas bestiolae]|uniref:YbaY family lipoprotein n=1 Tax=Carnimonas bestiolae TaxID=3402172 RepID=UPI003F4AD789